MKILIISAFFFKAEGSLAKGIARILPNHDVFFFSTGEIKHRKREFETLLQQVDVVHWLFNVAHLNKSIAHYYEHCKVPQIATVHHVCAPELDKVKVAAHADLVHVVSNEWKEFVEKYSSTKCVTAHLGINPDNFIHIQPHLYEKGAIKIGLMGFYPGKYNRKRVDVAMDVFKSLKAKNISFEVILQGGGWENYLPELEENNISFHHIATTSGNEILKFFEKIHVYLCTSDYEGGPLPVLESLQSGVPVVSTDIGVARDALENGGGILCEKGNVDELSDALIHMQKDALFYAKCVEESKPIAAKFHWENLHKEYQTLYKTAIVEWENKHGVKWSSPSSHISAAKQRKRELVHDQIHEGLFLLYRGKIKQGLSLLLSPLLSNAVSFKRKQDILFKRVGVFVLTGKKN